MTSIYDRESARRWRQHNGAITTTIPNPLLDRIDAIARKSGLSRSALLRRIVEKYAEDQENSPR